LTSVKVIRTAVVNTALAYLIILLKRRQGLSQLHLLNTLRNAGAVVCSLTKLVILGVQTFVILFCVGFSCLFLLQPKSALVKGVMIDGIFSISEGIER